MAEIHGNAFITTRKGTCYLTIKINRRNAELMKIRQYKIYPDEKRQMRRLYPNVTVDWKKIWLRSGKYVRNIVFVGERRLKLVGSVPRGNRFMGYLIPLPIPFMLMTLLMLEVLVCSLMRLLIKVLKVGPIQNTVILGQK
jgi:hypothetical protein